MTEKLTPEEIKKALECCGSTEEDSCFNCPLYGSPAPECGMRLCRESLKLHNRQQAEIERLKNDLAISRKETKRYAMRNSQSNKVKKRRKYIRKCGLCGERHEQSEMIRTNQVANGWLCYDCYEKEGLE